MRLIIKASTAINDTTSLSPSLFFLRILIPLVSLFAIFIDSKLRNKILDTSPLPCFSVQCFQRISKRTKALQTSFFNQLINFSLKMVKPIFVLLTNCRAKNGFNSVCFFLPCSQYAGTRRSQSSLCSLQQKACEHQGAPYYDD